MRQKIQHAIDDERSDTAMWYGMMTSAPVVMWYEHGDFNSGAFLGLAAFFFVSLIVTRAIDDKKRQKVVADRAIRAGKLMIVVAFFSALMALVRMHIPSV